jgi:hypothetical protein
VGKQPLGLFGVSLGARSISSGFAPRSGSGSGEEMMGSPGGGVPPGDLI